MRLHARHLAIVAIFTSFLVPIGGALFAWVHVEAHHHTERHHDKNHDHDEAPASRQPGDALAELVDLLESVTHGHPHDTDKVRHAHIAEPPPASPSLTSAETDSSTTARAASLHTAFEHAPVFEAARPPPTEELFRLHCALLL